MLSAGVVRIAAALAFVVSLAAAPAAPAAPITDKKAIWGPVRVDGVSQFPIYRDLGVGIWQIAVRWDAVAPTRPARPGDPEDPAYVWPAEVDDAIAEGRRHGIEVAVMLLGAPGWANGGKAWRWAPRRPQDFATFSAAASRRWPAVRHWMVWGEPTKASNFQPLQPDEGRPLEGRRALAGPRRYARILDATYGALKRVQRRDLVVGGNSYTVGAVRPLFWIRALRLPNGRPPRMDLYGHNPFSLRAPDLDDGTLGPGYADFNDLDTLVAALDRNLGGRLKVFMSEYTLPTNDNHEFNFHVTEAVQARWLRAALRITRGWRRLYSLGYLGLYDDALRDDGQQVDRGLIRRDGTHRPAYRAFKSG